jgi:3'-5' exoribonuclease
MDLLINSKNYMIFDLIKNVKDDRPFIRLVLVDKDNKQINGIMLNSKKLDFEPEKGDVVSINGNYQSHNGQLQIKIDNMTKLTGEDYYDFLPKSKFDKNQMLKDLKSILYREINTIYYKHLLDKFFNDSEMIKQFLIIPAAKSVHHAYISGLLEHTLGVVKLVNLISENYKNKIDKELLLLGALFHDIGKIKELEVKKGFDYTIEGKLVGHLVIGINIIEKYINDINNFPKIKKLILLHMIASHHGLTDFGAIKKPKTLESLILHHADDLDAKINTFSSIFEKENLNKDEWSNYDRLLDRQILKHI